MEYKPGWESVKEHMAAWWRGEGMVLAVYAPREEPLFHAPLPILPQDPRERWLDAETRIRHTEYVIARTFYGGDAFPTLNHFLGPGCLALYLGCEGVFFACEGAFAGAGNNDTVWYTPLIDDLDRAPPLRFDPANRYWQRHIGMIRAGVARAAGRYDVGVPDLVENIDILLALRGYAELLLDLIDRPRVVHRFQRQVLELYFRYFDEIYETVKDRQGGSSFQTFRVWAPGRMAKVQCDLGAAISPAMFREFVVPYLAEQCDRLDYSLFHLDGPSCIRHVDALMEIGSLSAVQWTPGAGQASIGCPRWYPLYERIRAAGKSLQLLGVAPDEVRPLVDAFGPEGLYVSSRAPTEAAARRLLAECGR